MRPTARWIVPVIAAPWLVWALVRILGLDRVYPLPAIVAFTPYAALTSVLPLLVALVARRWLVAVTAAVVCGLFALAVLPRAFGTAAPPGSGAELTVMSSNLYVGRADPQAIVDLVRRRDVDVLILVELTPRAIRALDAAGLARLMPQRVIGGEGSAVYARGTVRRDPASATQPVSAPVADVQIGGLPPLRIQAAHPYPPITNQASEDWRGFLSELDGPPAGGRPSVLAGDFNATLDHRDLRRLLDRGWRDAADVVGQGLRPTWPVGRRALPITIDHILVGPGVRVRSFDTAKVPGSDHRAVLARLAVPVR